MLSLSDRQHDAFDNAAKMACQEAMTVPYAILPTLVS